MQGRIEPVEYTLHCNDIINTLQLYYITNKITLKYHQKRSFNEIMLILFLSAHLFICSSDVHLFMNMVPHGPVVYGLTPNSAYYTLG